jgi:hypothetical protein
MAHAQPKKSLVQLIQGGTSSRTKGKLFRAIADAKATNGRDYDCFYLFPDREGNYDASGFGYIKTKDVRNFSTHEALSKCKVVPVPLHDITEDHSWTSDHILAMWAVAGYIKRQLESGMVIVISCTAGKNRSPALQYAVDPTGAYSGKTPLDMKARVKCPLMRRWAEAFHESPGRVPDGLAPLVAKARTANPFDSPFPPGTVKGVDDTKAKWPSKLQGVNRPDLHARILARVGQSVGKTIAK